MVINLFDNNDYVDCGGDREHRKQRADISREQDHTLIWNGIETSVVLIGRTNIYTVRLPQYGPKHRN